MIQSQAEALDRFFSSNKETESSVEDMVNEQHRNGNDNEKHMNKEHEALVDKEHMHKNDNENRNEND